MIKFISIFILSLMLTGCAGTGFNKKCTVMPDEVWVGADMNEQNDNNWKVGEIGGGMKWKLK